MKYIDINKLFTERVSEYLVKGYVINSASMAASQGERAHVDLTDGTEIIRIYVANFYNDGDGVEIVVGRSTDNITPHSDDHWDVLWTSNLEVLSRSRFYKVGGEYATRDETHLEERDAEEE